MLQLDFLFKDTYDYSCCLFTCNPFYFEVRTARMRARDAHRSLGKHAKDRLFDDKLIQCQRRILTEFAVHFVNKSAVNSQTYTRIIKIHFLESTLIATSSLVFIRRTIDGV